MLAQEFGYQVSSRLAAEMTPNVRTRVDAALEEWRNRATPRGSNVVYGGGAFIAIAGLWMSLWMESVLPVLATAVVTVLVVASSEGADSKVREELANLEQVVASVLLSPWQAWPCRVEEIAGVPDKALLLLGPDGAVACTYQSPMPDDVWIGLTDGRGMIWFAGDVRFGGIVAMPGGQPIWWARTPKVNISPGPANARQHLVEEELIRQAVAYAFGEWL